jgi:hypothetical protein
MSQSRRSAGDSLEDDMAAEFAAVREPLERRVAQLEAALRDISEHDYRGGAYSSVAIIASLRDKARAALAGEKEEK